MLPSGIDVLVIMPVGIGVLTMGLIADTAPRNVVLGILVYWRWGILATQRKLHSSCYYKRCATAEKVSLSAELYIQLRTLCSVCYMLDYLGNLC